METRVFAAFVEFRQSHGTAGGGDSVNDEECKNAFGPLFAVKSDLRLASTTRSSTVYAGL